MGDSYGNFEIFVRKLRAGFPFCGGYAIIGQMRTDGRKQMETKIVKIRPEGTEFSPEEDAGLRQAGRIIKEGGLVAFPTETVYGLGGDALNRESSRKIYAAKGRPSDNPLIIHICQFEDIRKIVSDLPEAAKKAADAFWPGPLTMILPKSEIVPYETTGGLDTVAVPSPTEAKYVVEDMDGRIEMILDGGAGQIGLESTILDLTVSPPQILRPGYITKQMLEEVLGRVDTDVTILTADSGQAPKAPGMKYRHYAPKGDLLIVEGEPEAVSAYINEQTAADKKAGEKTGVIGTRERLDTYRADSVKCVGSRQEEAGIAHSLYTILRQFDDEGVTKIYSESFEADGLGQAIMNRLLKAAGHHVKKL